ncbi:MAG: MAPEG family protein [Gammaproteobacteria bacterium]
MTSVLYASVLAFFIVWLSLNVIGKRRQYRISTGHGDNHALKIAIAAQSNAIEYIPIALLLLFALEYNGAHQLMVHGLGLVFVAGRWIHARGLLTEVLNIRVLGMKITLYSIIALAVINLVYLPYIKLLG